MAALLAALVVVVCLSAGAHAGATDDGCPTSDSSPRFCAWSGAVDPLPVVVAPAIPAASQPEPALWLPAPRAARPGFQRHIAGPVPRAPPSFLV
jgi:hypothetical protein